MPKQRYTLHLPSDLVERLRDAVYWTPGLTLAQLAEGALREAVDELEASRGQAFPQREGELSAGRPIGRAGDRTPALVGGSDGEGGGRPGKVTGPRGGDGQTDPDQPVSRGSSS